MKNVYAKGAKMEYNVVEVCRHIINYSNKKWYGVSNLKLQKLLYFVQAYFLITKRRACFRERIEAWDFGPVVPVAYREYKQFGGCNIPTVTHVVEINRKNIWDSKIVPYYDSAITEEDKKLIEAVVDKFSDYSAADLVRLTHEQAPWIDAYIPNRNNEITIQSIEEYFNA